MSILKFSVIFALLCLSLAPSFSDNVLVRAEEEEADIEEEEETTQTEETADEYEDESSDMYEEFEEGMLTAAEDVSTTFYFPKYSGKKIPSGKPVDVLVGFTNKGDETYQVSHIGAYLHSPFDFNYYIQNFTFKGYGVVIQPNSEATFKYTFQTDPTLLPLEYWQSAFIQYNSSTNEVFRNTVYNGTVELFELAEEYDAQKFFTQALIALVVVGTIGFFVMNVKGKLDKKKKAETGTRSAVTDEDWLANKVYKPKSSASRAGKKSGKARKKNQ